MYLTEIKAMLRSNCHIILCPAIYRRLVTKTITVQHLKKLFTIFKDREVDITLMILSQKQNTRMLR
jgi:hypothetical protein